jgi:hypothetical protein
MAAATPQGETSMRILNPRRASWIAAFAVIAFSANGYAQVDGWGSDGGPGSPTYTSQSAFGVTLGTNALQATTAQGGFWGPSTGNLVGQGFLSALQNGARISFDLTLLSQQINGGSGNFSGFAQGNEMAWQLFAPSGTAGLPNGINIFSQVNFTVGNGTDTSGQGATWSGVDGTRTITFDLSTFMGTDPNDGQTKSVRQLLMLYPAIPDAKFDFTEQTGGGTPVGPASFFYDNVRILDGTGGSLALIGNFEPVPEPTSLILAGLAVPPAIVAIRRRRNAKAIAAA